MTPVCKQKRLREFFLGKRFSRYLNHCMFSFSYDQITSLSIFKDLNWGSSSRAYMITSENLQRFNKSWKKLFLEKILWLYVYCWPNGEIPLLSSSFLGFNFLIRSWDTTWGWLFSFSLYLWLGGNVFNLSRTNAMSFLRFLIPLVWGDFGKRTWERALAGCLWRRHIHRWTHCWFVVSWNYAVQILTNFHG